MIYPVAMRFRFRYHQEMEVGVAIIKDAMFGFWFYVNGLPGFNRQSLFLKFKGCRNPIKYKILAEPVRDNAFALLCPVASVPVSHSGCRTAANAQPSQPLPQLKCPAF